MKRCCKNCNHSQQTIDGTYWCNEYPRSPKRVLKTFYDNEDRMECKYCKKGAVKDE